MRSGSLNPPNKNDDHAKMMFSDEKRSFSPSRRSRSSASPRHGRTRVDMDGSVSYLDGGAKVQSMLQHFPSRSPPRKGISQKKKEMIKIDDPELAKKLERYLKRKERKRKRREQFRLDPMIFLNSPKNKDSLGDLSRSNIENLYGSLPTPPHEAPGDDDLVDASDEISINTDEMSEAQESLSQSRSIDNEVLLQTASIALERYLARTSSLEPTTFSPSPQQVDDPSKTILNDSFEDDAILDKKITRTKSGTLFARKSILMGFVEELQRERIAPELPRKMPKSKHRGASKGSSSTKQSPSEGTSAIQGELHGNSEERINWEPKQISQTEASSSHDSRELRGFEDEESLTLTGKTFDTASSTKVTEYSPGIRSIESDGARGKDQERGTARRRKGKRLGCVAAFLVLSAASLVVWLLSKNDIIGGGISSSSTSIPTDSAEMSPSFRNVFDAIKEEFGGNTASSVLEPTSPQAQAAKWMAENDSTFTFPLRKEASTRTAFRQRYAIAVFFLGTGGRTSWANNARFLSLEHECLWGGDADGAAMISCLGDRIIGLKIRDNGLSNSIADEIWGMENLEALDLRNNEIAGTLPEGIYRLARLNLLDLSLNPITGEIGSAIGSLGNLERLQIEESSIHGRIPSQLFDLTSLRTIRLQGNFLEGPLLGNFQVSLALEEIDISANGIGGTIPDALADLPRLKRIDLSENIFTGKIPQGSFRFMQAFSAHSNDLTGPVSSSLIVESLQSLNLRNNRLDGELPQIWFVASSLSSLDLSGNLLSGTLPDSLGNTNLESIRLHDNAFSGNLPRSFALLPLGEKN